jgi:hypothetical protein
VTFGVAAPNATIPSLALTPAPVIGSPSGNMDEQATVTATVVPPSGVAGSTSWLQVLVSAQNTLSGPSIATATRNPGTVPPWLDSGYPLGYPAVSTNGYSTSFLDQPMANIWGFYYSGYTTVSRQLAFSLYLLWQPTISSQRRFPCHWQTGPGV